MQRTRPAQIVEATDVVDDRERRDVVEQRVDGEVAPKRIFFGRAEGVVAMNQLRFCFGGLRGITLCAALGWLLVMFRCGHAIFDDLFRPAAPDAGTWQPR